MKMEQTVCYETLAYKIQMQGNHPEESLQQYLKSIYHESLQTGRLKTIMKF
jgi:hypothetical protein